MMIYGEEMYHHGVQGQKWGVRRYQNEDGSLTAAGREHYGYKYEKRLNRMENAQVGRRRFADPAARKARRHTRSLATAVYTGLGGVLAGIPGAAATAILNIGSHTADNILEQAMGSYKVQAAFEKKHEQAVNKLIQEAASKGITINVEKGTQTYNTANGLSGNAVMNTVRKDRYSYSK